MRKIPSNKKALGVFGLTVLASAILAGCNLYSFIDKPKGDEQILSKARACFDQADYSCAREYYAQLSTDYADIRTSEEAFLILAENGATMADFMETFGSGGSGQALTELAERMAPGSEAKRLKMQEAFKKFDEINVTSNPSLRALVRFVSSVALAAEFLSEEITSSGGQLTKNKIATGGAACTTDAVTGCAGTGAASCGAPGVIQNSNTAVDFLGAPITGNIDLGYLDQAMSEMQQALQDLQASGGFSSGAGDMAGDILGSGNPAAPACYRAVLIEQGIGR